MKTISFNLPEETFSVNNIVDTTRIGLVFKNERFVIINTCECTFQLMNSNLVTVFNKNKSDVYRSKKDLIVDINSKHKVYPLMFDTHKELMQWFSK